MMFTADEISMIKIYHDNNSEKNSLIKEMKDSLPLVEDPEIAKIMESAIKKVCSLDDAAYDNLDFSQALVYDDTDETEN